MGCTKDFYSSTFNLEYQWWFEGTLQEFQAWYLRLGTILWLIKSIIIVLAFVVIIYLIFIIARGLFNWLKSISNYFLTISVLCVVVILGLTFDVHSFSSFPMYTSFPNWSYVFVLEDLEGNNIPYKEYTNYTVPDICDLYYSYMQSHGEQYGEGRERIETAKQAARKIASDLKFKGNTREYRIVRLYYRIEGRKIVKMRDILYEKRF